MAAQIVITGAPSAGKTKFLHQLKREPFARELVFLDELARTLLQESPDWRNNWGEFHREIYRRQVARESKLEGRSFVTDRGTLDGFAFHPESLADVGTTIEREFQRYTAVFHLESSANLGEEFYVQDEERIETIDDVLVIEQAIADVYNSHPGYEFIRAASNVDDKYRAFKRAVQAHLER